MPTQAFISGLPEFTSGLLPIVIVGAWTILFLLHQRRQRIQAESVNQQTDFDQTDQHQLIPPAANRIKLAMDRGWMIPGPGRGRNPTITPGKSDETIGYENYDPELGHRPNQIHSRRSVIKGRPVVSLHEEEHEENVLIVIDGNMVDLAGSPNDYVDAILAMELVAKTLVKAVDEDYYRVGLVITRQRSPLYCPPGWPIEEIKHAIRRLQPGDNPKQDRSLRKMVMDVTSNVKHAIVISNFQRPDSIALLKQLPQGCTKIAVKVSSGWDYELEGLHDRTTFDIGDNQLREVNVAQIKGTYSQTAAIEQSRIREQIGQGQVFPCEVRQDQPDIPGQLADQLKPLAA